MERNNGIVDLSLAVERADRVMASLTSSPDTVDNMHQRFLLTRMADASFNLKGHIPAYLFFKVAPGIKVAHVTFDFLMLLILPIIYAGKTVFKVQVTF